MGVNEAALGNDSIANQSTPKCVSAQSAKCIKYTKLHSIIKIVEQKAPKSV